MVDRDKGHSFNGDPTTNNPSNIDRRVGRRIKIRRLLLEIELHDLAGDLGILASVLARIEAGEERPSPAMLSRIASYLGVNASWFFRDLESGSLGASAEPQLDAKAGRAWAFAQPDMGTEMFDLLDYFLQADRADRQAILDYTRQRVAKGQR